MNTIVSLAIGKLLKEKGLTFSSAQYPPKYYNSPTEAYEDWIEYCLKQYC